MSVTENKNTERQSRLNVRLSTAVKERVARAATIVGQDLTEFAVSTLSQKADEVIKKHDSVLLGSEDYRFFLDALSVEETGEPSEKSNKAADRYRRGKRKGARYQIAD